MASILIGMPADDVFDFVSRPENMPRYLDHVASIQSKGEGKLEIVCQIDGNQFQAAGWFEVDAHHLMTRWGAEGDLGYVGHMTVTPMDEGTCKVEVHLLFAGAEKDANGRDDRVWKAIDDALDCLKSISENSPQMLIAYRNSYMA
ncbi:MAG: SRPBCC family protein [Fimbriimonas sp.]